MFAGGEAALFLAQLAAERFLFEILELEFVENAADLDAEGRVLVVAIQAVGDGDDTDPGEMELGQQGEHEIVIAGQAREIIDQHDLECALLAGSEEGG